MEGRDENEGLRPDEDRICFPCGTTISLHANAAGEIVAADSRFRAHARVLTAGDTSYGMSFVDLVLTDTLHFNRAGAAVFDTLIGLDLDALDFQRVFQVAAAGDYAVALRVHSQATCDPGSRSCSAVDVSNTGYLGITSDFTSASGFRYPGYAAVGPSRRPRCSYRRASRSSARGDRGGRAGAELETPSRHSTRAVDLPRPRPKRFQRPRAPR